MLDLPAILKQAEAATEGPWINAHGEFVSQAETFMAVCRVNVPIVDDLAAGKTRSGTRQMQDANKDFIAQARTLVPQLVEELEEAQKALEKYGIHLTDCKWSGAEPSDCTCGLDRILKGEK